MKIGFKTATVQDIPLVLSFIRELAAYEKMSDEVIADEETLQDWLFEKKIAEVFFAVSENKEIGFVLFFHNFSTFLGRAGIYLEDLYVKPEYRGNGFGKKMFQELARIAVSRDCGRIEWSCLDWNTPSIEFYQSLGAVAMDEWTTYRLTKEKFTELAK